MSWTCSPASAIALRLASAARVKVVTPDLRENAVHPSPTIAVLSLIACSGMFTSFRNGQARRPAYSDSSPLVGKNFFHQFRVFVEVFRPSGIDGHNLGASHFHALVLRQIGSRDQSARVLIKLLTFFGQ